jgi:hypothetical protein
LMTLVLGAIAMGVMLKMYFANYLWRRSFIASNMLLYILLPKRTLPDLADIQPVYPL